MRDVTNDRFKVGGSTGGQEPLYKLLKTITRIVPCALLAVVLATCSKGVDHPSTQPAIIPRSYDLYSVAINSSGVFVVGSKGLLLRSSDRGVTWRRLPLLERKGPDVLQDLDLYSIRFTPDGQVGWIGGESGEILKSLDAGRTWNKVESPLRRLSIFRLLPIDSKVVCGVGDEGTLLHSDDGGGHWSLKSKEKIILFDVFLKDGSGWAVGDYDTILYTADKCQTWQVQNGGTMHALGLGAYFAASSQDLQLAWVGGLSGAFVSTSDGGKQWNHAPAVPTKSPIFALANTLQGLWLVGGQGTLLAMRADGHWDSRNLSYDDLSDIAFAGDLGIVVGAKGEIWRTDDGGRQWQSVGAR